MRTPIRRWQLRGLVLHRGIRQRTPDNRTASWGEPPVRYLPLVLRAHGKYQDTLAPLLPERLSRLSYRCQAALSSAWAGFR